MEGARALLTGGLGEAIARAGKGAAEVVVTGRKADAFDSLAGEPPSARPPRRAGALGLSVGAAVMLLLAVAPEVSAVAAGSYESVTRRHYGGHVEAGTGPYQKALGALKIELALDFVSAGETESPFAGGTSYRVEVAIHGRLCERRRRLHGANERHRHRYRCRKIDGSLSGDGTSGPHSPDGEPSIRLEGLSGRVTRIGVVKASGEMTGTGYVARGVRTLTLALEARNGGLTIAATGPPVGGFTAP